MSTTKFKISLNNARIPLISAFAQRAVLVPALDYAARSPKQFSGAAENLDFNVGMIIFAENAVPTSEGIKSTSYTRVIAPTVNTDFDQIFPLRDEDENQVLYSPGQGKNYVYDVTVPAWATFPIANLWKVGDPAAVLSGASINTPLTAKVTRAYVDGKTLICYSKLLVTHLGVPKDGSLFLWDTSLTPNQPTWINLTVASPLIKNLPPTIAIGEISGISNSNGYLLIFSGLTVAWAPFNGVEFDFASYASGEFTGSGYQIPEDIKGPIKAIAPVAGGFIIFSDKNAVGATYNSSNIASPWTFREVPNAGGVIDYEQLSVESSLGALYAYTSGGMQRISLNNAESSFPDVTDFLGGRQIETYNSSTKELIRSLITTEVFTKLTYLGNRFLIVSYGTFPGLFSWALIYDTGLERWGRLRLAHTDCFSYTAGVADAQLTYGMLLDVTYTDLLTTPYSSMHIPSSGVTYPRQVVGFLLRTGEVKLAVLDYRNQDEADTSESIVIIGRVQLSRSQKIELQRIELEGAASTTTCTVVPSYEGRTLAAAIPMIPVSQEGDNSIFGEQVCAENFNIHVENDFSLSTIIIEAQRCGRL